MRRRVMRFVGLLVLTSAVAACTSEWETRVHELERENMDLAVQGDGQRVEIADATAKNEALRLQTNRQAAELNNTRSQLQQAIDRANEHAQESDRLAGELAALQEVPAETAVADRTLTDEEAQSLFHDSQARDIRVDENGNIEITLQSDVTFGAGQAALTKKGQQSLRALEDALVSRYGTYQIRVIGHTDSTPLKRTKAKYGTNRGLGSARAIEVVQFLEQKLGVDSGRLMSASLGEHAPVSENKSKSGQSKNRRVEIVVVIPRSDAATIAAAK